MLKIWYISAAPTSPDSLIAWKMGGVGKQVVLDIADAAGRNPGI